MLSSLKRYMGFLTAHSTYVWILLSLYLSSRYPFMLMCFFLMVFAPFLSSSVCFRLTSFIKSKYGTIYYRLIPDDGQYYIRTYKYRYGVFIKENHSRNFTLSLDKEGDLQLIKNTVIETKEKSLSKIDRKKLKEKNLKAIQKRLMNKDLSVHSSDEEFLNQLKQL